MMDRSSSIAFLIFLSVIISTKVAAGDDHLVLPSATQLKDRPHHLPLLFGFARSDGEHLYVGGFCSGDTTARLSFHNNSNSPFGGGTLHITVNGPIVQNCSVPYIFATPNHVRGDFYVTTGEYTYDFYQWENVNEFAYVRSTGVAVFVLDPLDADAIQTLIGLQPLFSDSEAGELANIDYLKKHMGANFELRPEPSWVSNVNPDDIRSGDFIAVSKIRGNSGVFQTLQKWVTGAYAGHAAIFLRDPQGKLWVAESRSEEMEYMIVSILPWDQWWEYEKTKDPASPHIAVLPLHPDLRDKFDEPAAWNYALSLNNTPYGYGNFIFSWIDTVNGSYPSPITPELIASAMIIWSRVKPGYSIDMFDEALQKREGLTFGELLAIPEQDDSIYYGQSSTCIAFALTVYKHAGMFDPIASSVQTAEFTVKDAYQLKFYEDDISRLPTWCNAGDDDVELPYCQILGKYRMELPGYNTLIPYANMNEQCPSVPPNYERPSGC